MQYFFFLTGTATCTHSDCGDRPRHEDSQYHCKISPVFSPVEVSYRLSSFNMSLLSLLLLRYLLFFSFLMLLFSCENEDNGCVLSSAQVLLFCFVSLTS